MYILFETKKFCKSLKRISNSNGGNKIIEDLKKCVGILRTGNILDSNYKDHALKGEFMGYRECHIRGDILLVYTIEKDKMILILVEIGSHSYLF